MARTLASTVPEDGSAALPVHGHPFSRCGSRALRRDLPALSSRLWLPGPHWAVRRAVVFSTRRGRLQISYNYYSAVIRWGFEVCVCTRIWCKYISVLPPPPPPQGQYRLLINLFVLTSPAYLLSHAPCDIIQP